MIGSMRVRVVLSLALLVACDDAQLPTVPQGGRPSAEIMDAVHNNGNSHFFFLPPLVPQPSFNGTFDGSLSPVVEICVWNGAACEQPLVARYTMTTGPGSETVRMVSEEEHYVVKWHTGDFNLDPSQTYRIRVLVARTELGHADVDPVSSGKELRNLNTGQYIPLLNGRTLPIMFRIEAGAVFVVGAGGATVLAMGGLVTLEIPKGALESETGITVRAARDYPRATGIVQGTVFDFGPNGTLFSQPVELTISYNPAEIPLGVDEATLRLHHLIGENWSEIPNGDVDPVGHLLRASISHFSSAAAMPPLELRPRGDFSLLRGSSLQLQVVDGTKSPTEQVQWPSSDGVASVSADGLLTGLAVGSRSVRVEAGGKSTSQVVTVVPEGPFSDDLFTWPTDPTEDSDGLPLPCPGDWPKLTNPICFWLAPDEWRDVQPFQRYRNDEVRPPGYHLGADWNRGGSNADANYAVYAAANGFVSDTGDAGGAMGKWIMLEHPTSLGKFYSFYAHVNWLNDRPPVPGRRVSKGEMIALIGNAASIDYPDGYYGKLYHLHFEVRRADHENARTLGRGYSDDQLDRGEDGLGPQGQINPNTFISAHRTGSDLACTYPASEYAPDDNTVLLLHMNEDDGTSILRDASRYGHDGVATGTVVVPGVFGNARRFDNAVNAVAEHFITLSNSAILNPSTAATFEFWVFPTATTSIVDGWTNGNPILNRDDAWAGTPGYSFHLYTQPGFSANRPYFYDGVTLIAEAEEGLVIDRWSHIAFTFESVPGGKLGKLYVNGRLAAPETLLPGPLRTNSLMTYIGRRWGSGGGFPYNGGFLGAIDEVRISDRARLPSEFNCQS